MILIVDDHPDSCEPLKRLLTMVGHPAECVQSGPDALAYMRTVEPDAVVLDVRMPGMSGLDVLKIVRSDPNLYRFVGNSAPNGRDPSGMSAVSELWDAVYEGALQPFREGVEHGRSC